MKTIMCTMKSNSEWVQRIEATTQVKWCFHQNFCQDVQKEAIHNTLIRSEETWSSAKGNEEEFVKKSLRKKYRLIQCGFGNFC